MKTGNLCVLMMSLSTLASGVVRAESVDATIRLTERVPLEKLAKDVNDPHSARYGKFYSSDEIKKIAGLTDADYNKLINQLKSQGFTITNESKTHLWIGVRGDSKVFANVFKTNFSKNEKGERFLDQKAVVPSIISHIASVGGLNGVRHSRPFHRFQSDAFAGANSGLVPATIQKAYGLDKIYAAKINGVNQHIAIATYDDFSLPDVQKYYSTLKITPTPTVEKVKFNGTPKTNEDSAAETQLDVELSGMIAPGVNIHVYSSATNDDNGELQMFTSILNDDRIKIVNYSWGGCETQVTPEHAQDMTKVFAQAQAQGVNIMVASGDSGSDSCQDGTTAADWPAAHPGIVAVGGTTLTIGSNGSGSEVAWDGSGGGISKLFSSPDYQKGLESQYTIGRGYPDVAFNADPHSGQAIYVHQYGIGSWIVVGGTSMAAPQWAGFLALTANARAAKGLSPLGFLNPIIYAYDKNQQALGFNNITSGSNGAYSAGEGWNAVTGFGTMKANSLLNLLLGNN